MSNHSPKWTSEHTKRVFLLNSRYRILSLKNILARILIYLFIQKVKLDSFEVLQRFLDDVPRSYCCHIEELEVNTQSKNNSTNVPSRVRADALITLLSASLRIHKLVLTVWGSLDKSVISPFPSLLNLKQLSIANAGDEKRTPLWVLPICRPTVSVSDPPSSLPGVRGSLYRSPCQSETLRSCPWTGSHGRECMRRN